MIYYINDVIDYELYKDLYAALSAPDFDVTKVYITTNGGDVFLVNEICKLLEEYNSPPLVATNNIASGGWYIFYSYKGPKYLCPYFNAAMIHLPSLELAQTRVRGLNSFEYMAAHRHEEVLALYEAKLQEYLTAAEFEILKDGSDLWLSRQRVIEITGAEELPLFR